MKRLLRKPRISKSGAYTLLGAGIVGNDPAHLPLAGVLPIQLNGSTKYLTGGVMGALFSYL